MNWIYKVVTVDSLFKEGNDHDIAVSREVAIARRANAGESMEKALNELGKDSWELVSIQGEFGIFKKPSN
jgi:predicted regulator of Ras-like GTPase activity (Roadblock/LC7/MglB family)